MHKYRVIIIHVQLHIYNNFFLLFYINTSPTLNYFKNYYYQRSHFIISISFEIKKKKNLVV